MRTHEDYIRDIAAFVVMHADLNETERGQLSSIKLVYGSGPSGTRGVTFFGKWRNNETISPFVEVSAFGQESIVQLTGTTLHELGHVLAGLDAGHSKAWHEACERLGLVGVMAAGTNYTWDNFSPWVKDYVQSIEPPSDGEPVKSLITRGWNQTGIIPGMNASLGQILGRSFKLKGCQAGIGTRGGKSRGAGSGSRLRLFQCQCHGEGAQLPSPVKVRIAADVFDAIHKPCGKAFERV